MKNYIPSLTMDGCIITDQKGNEEAFYKAYKDLLGKARDFMLDLVALGVTTIDLSDQDRVFSEDEIWEVTKDFSLDKATGSDGFIGIFFQKAWEIIKVDLVAAIHKFFLGNGRGFGRLNQALITLISKTPDACAVFDFRPICLVQSMPKIASKLLTARLRPHMGELVQMN